MVAPSKDTHCHQGRLLFRPPHSHQPRPKENIDPEVSVVETNRTEISTIMREKKPKTESMSGSSSLRRRRRPLTQQKQQSSSASMPGLSQKSSTGSVTSKISIRSMSSSSVSARLKKGLKKLNGSKKKKSKSKSKNPPLVVETTSGAKKNRKKKKGGSGLQRKKSVSFGSLENKNQQEEPQTPDTFMSMFCFHSPCANDGDMDWMDNLYACATTKPAEITYSIMGRPDMKDHGGDGGSGGKKRVAAVAAKHNVTTYITVSENIHGGETGTRPRRPHPHASDRRSISTNERRIF
jgi:hypothetical protein